MDENNLQDEAREEELVTDVIFSRQLISEARRGIVKSHPGLETFVESEHAHEIRAMAAGMTIQEIMDFYCIEFKDLADLDQFFVCTMFLKGRVAAINRATDYLFKGMDNSKDSVKAAVTYLARFGETWEGIEDTAGKAGTGLTSVRIELVE